MWTHVSSSKLSPRVNRTENALLLQPWYLLHPNHKKTNRNNQQKNQSTPNQNPNYPSVRFSCPTKKTLLTRCPFSQKNRPTITSCFSMTISNRAAMKSRSKSCEHGKPLLIRPSGDRSRKSGHGSGHCSRKCSRITYSKAMSRICTGHLSYPTLWRRILMMSWIMRKSRRNGSET